MEARRLFAAITLVAWREQFWAREVSLPRFYFLREEWLDYQALIRALGGLGQ